MPVIKLWCLPADQSEEDLNRLHQSVVTAVTSITELGLKDENDMTCLFPADLMSYGLGSEIIVEIGGLFEKPERTLEILQRLAEEVGGAVKKLYPNAMVECFVSTFNPSQGFWSSSTQSEKEETPDDGHNFRDGVESGPQDPSK